SPVLLVDQSFGSGAYLQVFDLQGRSVYSDRLHADGRVELPLGSLSEGLYTMRLTGNGQVGIVRWVK
ncbi:MAG: T9SS type A sorting domain-containing protein, partial [Flavobacteriales bacterium]